METSKKLVILAAYMMLFLSTAQGQNANQQELPLQIDERYFFPLRSLENVDFQEQLNARLNKNPKWRGLIAQKKLAVGLVDISDPYNIRYAAVNGDEMMYAASLPKIAVLLAAEDAMDKGELVATVEVRNDMKAMISRSDNHATTRMIDRVGFQKIEDVLTDPNYGLYDEQYGGGLWVGKRYAASGARNPDPLEGLSHAATVSQVCRFYYLMATGKLVSCERSKQMLDIMADSHLHHKFVNSLDKVAPTATVYRKSGSWKTYHSDSVLVWGDGWRKYILVGLTDDPAGEQIMREMVFAVEDVLKKQTVLAENQTKMKPKSKG